MSRTWGLDLSTNPRSTAAVAVEWVDGGATVAEVHQPLDAAAIVDLIQSTDESWGVDVPFGWPDAFATFIHAHQQGPMPVQITPEAARWQRWRTRDIALRRTDQFIEQHRATRVRPLPAAFQLLGATAAMWSLVESELASRGVAIDRSGATGRVFETYPRAALAAWGRQATGKADAAELLTMFNFLALPDDMRAALDNDHACDALVCALVARAWDLGLTLAPDPADVPAARREGWIHVTSVNPAHLLR